MKPTRKLKKMISEFTKLKGKQIYLEESKLFIITQQDVMKARVKMNCSDRQLADEAGDAFRFDDRVSLGELDSTRSQIQHRKIIGRRHDLVLLTFTAWLRVM